MIRVLRTPRVYTDEKNVLRPNSGEIRETSSVHGPEHVHCVAMFAAMIVVGWYEGQRNVAANMVIQGKWPTADLEIQVPRVLECLLNWRCSTAPSKA